MPVLVGIAISKAVANRVMVPRVVQGDAPERLKAWRKANGVSQAQLAGLLKVSQPTVSELESGKVAPKITIANLILAQCGIPTETWGCPADRAA